MKRFCRCASFILAIVLFISTPAFAAESVTPKSSNFFMCSSTYLVKITEKQFKAYFEITAVGTMDELGARTVTIQRSKDGENWTSMKTYSSDDYENMIATNTVNHCSYFTYTGTVGYSYRAKVIYYAKTGNNIGEVIEYSETLTLS